jgi:hypothetical protein
MKKVVATKYITAIRLWSTVRNQLLKPLDAAK